MKKLILVVSLTTSLGGLSAFGQGYFQFVIGKSQVWDGFSTGTLHLSTMVNVAFLWAANGAMPQVDAILTSTPPNWPVSTPTFSTSIAWSAILTDPNYLLAVNTANSQVAAALSATNGGVSYNGGNAFAVSGTLPDVNYSLFFIGWQSTYATPALAAAANSFVGWSAPFVYQSYLLTETVTPMVNLTPQFGVIGLIPEPSTLALAGLGSLTPFLLRRRN